MAAPNMPKVIDYLSSRPRGAYGWQIAEFLESSTDSTGQTLARMLSRGKIVQQVIGDTRGSSIWGLPADAHAETPRIYRSKEILAAFQEAARAQKNRTMEVA